MMARSSAVPPRTMCRWCPAVLGVLVVVAVSQAGLSAQPDALSRESLQRRIEERFDLLVTSDSVSLRPSSPIPDVRWVEIEGDTITIDGEAVTGAELRDRLGADADLIIQLSYLDAAARRTLFESPQAPSTAADTPDPSSAPDGPRRRRSDIVRVGSSVTVDADELVTGDVVAIGGSARVNGEVSGDVVAIGGSVELGPNSLVNGDAIAVGGTIRRDPTAEVRGEVRDVGLGMISFRDWRPRSLGLWWNEGISSMFRLVSTLVRVGVLCLLVGLVMLLAREQIDRVGRRAAAEPVKSGAIGILSQLLFLPLLIVTIVVMVITIIGIPLLLLIPFVTLGLAIVGLLGFTSVAYHVGGLVNARFGWHGRGPLATALVGVLVVVAPLLLSRLTALAGGFVVPMTFGLSFLGHVVEYLAWTVGFGAVALSRFSPAPLLPVVGQETA